MVLGLLGKVGRLDGPPCYCFWGMGIVIFEAEIHRNSQAGRLFHFWHRGRRAIVLLGMLGNFV
ncbi:MULTISPECIES: hypothetical protein [unclassified Microcoleus]|uniref:hypothetical protein n=1 Tax=unclassified Microcoleus TaxID=2642155 RepID=UPI002FD29FCF